MTTAAPTPEEAERGALRAGLPLAADRGALVAAVAGLLDAEFAGLREVDLGEAFPAAAYRAAAGRAGAEGSADAAL